MTRAGPEDFGAVPVAARPVLAMVFVALFVLALLALSSIRSGRKRSLADRVEHYGSHSPVPPSGRRWLAAAAVGCVARLLGSGKVQRRLAERLDLAGIVRPPAEWVLLGCAACMTLSVMGTVVTGSSLAGVAAGTLAGWLGMRLALDVRISRRRSSFAEQLPDALQLVAGSLRSGFSLAQALDAIVGEGTQPMAGEVSRALAESRIGVEIADALDQISTRMDSRDMRWTVLAIRIQRQVGGNLAEVLTNTVETMRERAYLRRHVRALSAEGRLSAYILIAMPVLIGGWLFLSRREYLRPLYTTTFGLAMLIGAGVLMVTGALWMRKTVRVEV